MTCLYPTNKSSAPARGWQAEQARLDREGQLSRGERRVYDLARRWLERPGAPAYLTLSREWLAQQLGVSVSTVSRAFKKCRQLGLLLIRERWRRVGNLRRQVSNLLALPARPPELVNSAPQTRKQKTKTRNRKAFAGYAVEKRSGFESAKAILQRWRLRSPQPTPQGTG